MDGFDPKVSFGYETSKCYDALETRGDEEQTVAFLARLAGQRKALEFAASEYQRLAATSAAGSPGMVSVRDRLQQKARWLSDYAARPPAEVR